METTASNRKLAAIMFADLKDYSKKIQADEAGTLKLLEQYSALLSTRLPEYGGIIVKSVGDAFLVDFSSAVNAVQCALHLQRDARERNLGKTEQEKMLLRIGIHIGDVVVLENDIMGDAVNIASRIQPLAEPGGICITKDVYQQIQGKIPVRAIGMGARELKNIKDRVEVYRIATGEPGQSPWVFAAAWCRAKSPVFRRVGNILIVAVLLAAGKIVADTVIRVNQLSFVVNQAARTNMSIETGGIVASPKGPEGDYNVVIVTKLNKNGKVISQQEMKIPTKN